MYLLQPHDLYNTPHRHSNTTANTKLKLYITVNTTVSTTINITVNTTINALSMSLLIPQPMLPKETECTY